MPFIYFNLVTIKNSSKIITFIISQKIIADISNQMYSDLGHTSPALSQDQVHMYMSPIKWGTLNAAKLGVA